MVIHAFRPRFSKRPTFRPLATARISRETLHVGRSRAAKVADIELLNRKNCALVERNSFRCRFARVYRESVPASSKRFVSPVGLPEKKPRKTTDGSDCTNSTDEQPRSFTIRAIRVIRVIRGL
jgi:hypothetical protein